MKSALAQAEEDWPTLLARLERMRAAMLTADGAIVNLSADEVSLAASTPLVPALLAELPGSKAAASPAGWEWSGGVLVPSYDGLQVPTQVNYVAKAAPMYEAGETVLARRL